MRFATLISSLLPTLVAADFTIYTGTCTNGIVDVDQQNIATDGQGVCGGCSVDGDVGSGDLDGGNPCNPNSCTDDPLHFVYDGGSNTYNIIVANTGISVGTCNGLTGAFGACNTATLTCSTLSRYRCITGYCN